MDEKEPVDKCLLNEEESPDAKLRPIHISFWLAWLFWFVVLCAVVGVIIVWFMMGEGTAFDLLIIPVLVACAVVVSLVLAIIMKRDVRG